MILLDTNQLIGRPPGAPLLRMLKKAAEDTGHEVVLPEIVLEEYLAHYQHDVGEAAQAARKGIRTCNGWLTAGLATRTTCAFGEPRDIEFERLTAETEAFQVGPDTWAFARGLWHGRTSTWYLWKPELVPGSSTGKNINVGFTVGATVGMQLDATCAVISADVTDRGRITVTEAGCCQPGGMTETGSCRPCADNTLCKVRCSGTRLAHDLEPR